MKQTLALALSVLPLLSSGVFNTSVVQAAELNIAGSTAGRFLAIDVPLNLCPPSPVPTHYVSASNDLHVWTCDVLNSTIIRFASTSSYQGIDKLLSPASSPGSQVQFLNHNLTTGCTGPIPQTRPSDNKQYNLVLNCSNGNLTPLGVHMGVSAVEGDSFHQVGPLGTFVNSIDDSVLNSVPVVTVPYSIFVGKGVVKVVGGGPGGQIDGLSRLQIEQVFARGVTDWQRLGFGTVTDAAPGQLEATSPIVLCLRSAGSGRKAAFDETLMINTTETSLANASVIFSSSPSGVADCLAAHRRSIGYMVTDEILYFNSQIGPNGPNFGKAYVIRVDGGLANDPSLADPKQDLKCGKYAFWTPLRLYRRLTSEGVGTDSLAGAFVNNAQAASTIGILQTAAYWVSNDEMVVIKNSDRGPLNWKAGNHPECR